MVCDECARQGITNPSQDVVTYTVQQGTTRARTDLCNKHDTVLRNILLGYGNEQSTKSTINEDRFEEMFATMEEVEAARKTYIKKQKSAT